MAINFPTLRRLFAAFIGAALFMSAGMATAWACRGTAEYPQVAAKLASTSLPQDRKDALQRQLDEGRAMHDAAHQQNDTKGMQASLQVLDQVANVLVAQAQPDLNGVWRGTFTNRQGTGFPVAFTLTVADGKITGTGDIPSSSVDRKPSVTGTVEGNRVVMQTSSGFRYDLTVNAEGTRLNGNVSGTNSGTLSLAR